MLKIINIPIKSLWVLLNKNGRLDYKSIIFFDFNAVNIRKFPYLCIHRQESLTKRNGNIYTRDSY